MRLIDFGLADDDAHYLARTLGCTPAYASPELLMQEENIDARSDIYSLGMIMHDIFGNRYLRIAGRCLCAQRGRRYANAEELLGAFRRSCSPLKGFAPLFLALLFLAPLLYYGVEYVAEKRKLAERDDMIARIEQDVTAICAVTLDSLAQVPYYEFAVNHIVSFYEAVGEYQVDNVSSVTNPELYSLLMAVHMKKLDACQKVLWKKAGELPSFYKCDLPTAAVLYYDSLFSNRGVFVPYRE